MSQSNDKMPMSRWIWLPAEQRMEQEQEFVWFRRTFQAHAREKITIRISADTRYRLYLNGSLLSVGPAKGNEEIWYYDTVCLTEAVCEGINVIAVQVLHYPASRKNTNHSLFPTTTPGLWIEPISAATKEPAQMDLNEMLMKDPTLRQELYTDAEWLCYAERGRTVGPEAAGFAPICGMEKTKGDPRLKDLWGVGFSAEGWQKACPYTAYEVPRASAPGNLFPRPVPPVRLEKKHFVAQVIKGCTREYSHTENAAENKMAYTAPHRHQQSFLSATSKGEYLQDGKIRAWCELLSGKGTIIIPPHTCEPVEFSAGAEETGFIHLEMAGGAGASVEFLSSEGYVPSTRLRGNMLMAVKGDRTDAEHGFLDGYTDQYRAGGFGTAVVPERWEPFWYKTFRFVRLTVTTREEPLELRAVHYLGTGYPFTFGTSVETSMPEFREIWDISLRTLERCTQETYMDCPFYEQLQYAMDSRSEILYTYTTAADDRMARQCMDDFRRSQRSDGLLNASYPSHCANVIPGFSIFYILMVWDHMRYFGDQELVKKHLPCIDGILGCFDRHLNENGIVGNMGGMNMLSRYWSFIDWIPEWDKTTGVPTACMHGPVTMESLLYIAGLQAASELNRYVHRESTADEYMERAHRVQAAVKRHCMGENGLLRDGPEVDMYAQHTQIFAILTDTMGLEDGRNALLKTLEEPAKYAQASVSFMYYLFRALEKTDLYAYTDERWDIWRGMLRDHLTTCVENYTDQRSDCHAWAALALYELPSVVLGVKPAASGYQKIAIRPCPGKFTHASGIVCTPKGLVKVAWRLNTDGSFCLSYEAPDGIEVIREK